VWSVSPVLDLELMVAGIAVRFASDRDSIVFDSFRDEFGAMIVPPHATARSAPPVISITVRPRDWNEPSPLKLPHSAKLIRIGGRKVFEDGERFWIDFHENAFFRIEGNEAEGVCYAPANLDPAFWTEICLNHILFLLLRRQDRHFLHAGGAVAPGGSAILFLGNSGSGKTTTALRLGAAGWPYFGDDCVLYDSERRVYPFPRRPAATTWTVETLGIEDRVRSERKTGKKLIEPWAAAAPTDRPRFFLPIPSSTGRNTIHALSLADARDLVKSQASLCETDQRIAGGLPDTEWIAERTGEIRIGDLARLPADLAANLLA
jgi:hypothetical protein